MDDEAAVLEANAEFYRCFRAGDLNGLEQLLAQQHLVACVHPGAQPLHGRHQVLSSWRLIFRGEDGPDIRCSDARAFVAGDSAFVTCIERLGGGSLVATNLFVRESDVWRLVHHHASPLTRSLQTPPAPTLN